MNVPETFFSVQEELFLFLLSCVSGVFIGIFYDVFRAIRLIINHNTFFVVIEDVIFLGCYAVFLSAFASVMARGELRFYFIIGNAIGFIIYFFTIGSVIIRSLKKLFDFIFTPIKSLYVIFFNKAKAKFVGSSKLSVKYIKKIKILLPNKPDMMYNIRESNKRKNVNVVAQKRQKKSRGKKTSKTEKKSL